MMTYHVLTEEPVKMWTLVGLSAAVPLVLKGKDARPSHVGQSHPIHISPLLFPLLSPRSPSRVFISRSCKVHFGEGVRY